MTDDKIDNDKDNVVSLHPHKEKEDRIAKADTQIADMKARIEVVRTSLDAMEKGLYIVKALRELLAIPHNKREEGLLIVQNKETGEPETITLEEFTKRNEEDKDE